MNTQSPNKLILHLFPKCYVFRVSKSHMTLEIILILCLVRAKSATKLSFFSALEFFVSGEVAAAFVAPPAGAGVGC